MGNLKLKEQCPFPKRRRKSSLLTIVLVDFYQMFFKDQTLEEREVNTDSGIIMPVVSGYSQRNKRQDVRCYSPVYKRLQTRKRIKSTGTVWASDFYMFVFIVQHKLVTECFTLRNSLSLERFLVLYDIISVHVFISHKWARVQQSSFDRTLQLKQQNLCNHLNKLDISN